MIKRVLPMLIFLNALSGMLFANGSDDAQSGKLVINSNLSDPIPKEVFAEIVAGFEAENPDIEVTLNSFDHEAYKTTIRNFLVSNPPDVCLWFAGNRMKFFVDQGLFADISDVWMDNGLTDAMSSTMSSLTVDGKQYGVPFAYYQWGIFYRKDIFDKYGLSEPATWNEFLNIGDTLTANGITPVTIGTKFLWTAAGWFDYLNLRINGYDFHMSLMEGKESYLDSRLDRVFDVWGDLVKRGFFLKNHETYSWQEAQAPLINGEAAMYLIGGFIMGDVNSAGIGDDMGFFQFPTIDSSVGIFEDAPTDTYHIPAGAKNMKEAKRFLAYVSKPEAQARLAYSGGTLPANKNSAPPSDWYTQEGFDMLASADGLAQFYDRDTNPELAKSGMEGFQRFMVQPEKETEIREAIEKERQSIFDN